MMPTFSLPFTINLLLTLALTLNRARYGPDGSILSWDLRYIGIARTLTLTLTLRSSLKIVLTPTLTLTLHRYSPSLNPNFNEVTFNAPHCCIWFLCLDYYDYTTTCLVYYYYLPSILLLLYYYNYLRALLLLLLRVLLLARVRVRVRVRCCYCESFY